MSVFPQKFLALTECSIDSKDSTYLRDPNRYHRTTAKQMFAQYFDLELVTVGLNVPQALELVTWLIEHTSGQHGTFYINNPFHSLLLNYETQPIRTRLSANLHANSVSTKNHTISLIGGIKVGTFFNFDNHPKVYMITNVPASNEKGESVITFTPRLYHHVPANTKICYGADCLFKVSCQADHQSLTTSVSYRRMTAITIPVRERA